MTFTVEQKNLLTKLMASENLTIEHQAIYTAKFDPVNRVLCLPIWKDMTGFMYDHLGGHEVGHALYTPADGWHGIASDESKGKNFKSFLNVIEDARIEKKVTRKFPGLRISFKKGFQELIDRDFFGVKNKNVNELSFIERLNLYTKSQYSADWINFTDEENAFIEKVKKLETWEDVLSLTDEIYDYSKNEQYEKMLEKLQDFQQEDSFEYGEDSENDSYGDDDYDYDESDSEEGNESDRNDPVNSDENSDASENSDDDFDSDDKSESTINRNKKSQESDRDQFSPECKTDENYRRNEISLLDEKSKEYLYLTIPQINEKQVFVSSTEVQKSMTDYYNERIYKDLAYDNNFVQKLVSDFKNKNERYIGLLAKEFEMRKAAKSFSKSKISDTGDIDINKLSSYKFDDNIFRKVMIVPKGKSHGLVLLLDCSGSMSDNMSGSIEQVLVLSMFCRKVNIPFRVFGFTDNSSERNGGDAQSFSRNKNELFFSNVQLREYLHSKMSNSEFSKSLRNMILLKESYRTSFSRIGRPRTESLSNTPLIQAIFAVGSIMKDFRQVNNIDLASLVIVHDGDADDCTNYCLEYTDKYTSQTRMISSGFNTRYNNIVIRDIKNKFEYGIFHKDEYHSTNEQVLICALKWISEVCKCKVFGFFILGRPSRAKNAIRYRYHFEDYKTLNEMRSQGNNSFFEKEKELFKQFRKDKFLVSKTKGYNSFYLISGGSDLETEKEQFEIQGKVTTGKLKNAFMEMTKKKQVNRVLVSKFIQEMAV